MKLFLILGNQLFSPKYLSDFKDHTFFMAEDYGLCTFEKHHKLKILLFLSSMRSFKDELKSKNFNVVYKDVNKDFKLSYEKKLEKIIKEKKPTGKWAVITTIVSSRLVKKMVNSHEGSYFEVLTGFKYIGEWIHKWEKDPNGYDFLFGFEESLGYLIGTHSRDKDATIAACMTAEVATLAKRHNKTLYDFLIDIYTEYGIFREGQRTIECEQGEPQMLEIMARIRKSHPKTLCDIPVVTIEDYQTRKGTNLSSGETWDIDLPTSNVLTFTLEDRTTFIVRPSGTEPKVKLYGMVESTAHENIKEGIAKEDTRLASLLDRLEKELTS